MVDIVDLRPGLGDPRIGDTAEPIIDIRTSVIGTAERIGKHILFELSEPQRTQLCASFFQVLQAGNRIVMMGSEHAAKVS